MPDRPQTFVLALLVLTGCGGPGPGVDAYDAGRFEEAHAAFAAAEQRAGADASATLLYDRSLAALRVGELGVAESAAQRAAERDDAFEGRRDFLLGSVAYARSELAEAQARSPEAEPFAFDVAIRHAESARDAWTAAAASRDTFPGKPAAEWPEALRNAQRAVARVEDLRRQKAEKESDPKKVPDSPEPPRPGPGPGAAQPPDTPGGDPETAPDGAAAVVEAELTADELQLLFEKLATKEREKLDVRRARRREQPPEVTRDW